MANTNMTTNLPNGVTNVQDAQSATLGSLPFPDPSRCHTWFDDFDDYDSSQWVITSAGSGTVAIQNADGGILLVTTATTDNDHYYFQWAGVTSSTVVETFKWEAGKGFWFKARFKMDEVVESDMVIGLQTTDTTPLDAADGLFFIKEDGSAVMTFRAEKDNTATVMDVATLTADTYCTVGFWWNPDLGEMTVYYNDKPVSSTLTTTNFPDDEELTISFAVQTGQISTAKSLYLDYIMVSKDRQQTIA